jgi:glutaconate CoA-transferase subunit B
MAVMRFHKETKLMYLEGYYPGVTPEKVVENTGFDVDVTQAAEVAPPTSEELKILREECDPQGLILG